MTTRFTLYFHQIVTHESLFAFIMLISCLQTSVVFVSNKKQVVPLWRQRAGKDEEKLVIWDYHAVLIYRPDHRWDIDVWPVAS